MLHARTAPPAAAAANGRARARRQAREGKHRAGFFLASPLDAFHLHARDQLADGVFLSGRHALSRTRAVKFLARGYWLRRLVLPLHPVAAALYPRRLPASSRTENGHGEYGRRCSRAEIPRR